MHSCITKGEQHCRNVDKQHCGNLDERDSRRFAKLEALEQGDEHIVKRVEDIKNYHICLRHLSQNLVGTQTCMYIDRLQGVVWLFPPGEAMGTAIVRLFWAALVWGK